MADKRQRHRDERIAPRWDGRHDSFAAWKRAYALYEAAWARHQARNAPGSRTQPRSLAERYHDLICDAIHDEARRHLPPEVVVRVTRGDRNSVAYLGGRLCAVMFDETRGPKAMRDLVRRELGRPISLDRGLVQSLDYLRRLATA